MLNNYDRVMISPESPPNPDAKYKIMDVSLEYETITKPDLTKHIVMEHQSMVLLYDRVLRDRQFPVNKLDAT